MPTKNTTPEEKHEAVPDKTPSQHNKMAMGMCSTSPRSVTCAKITHNDRSVWGTLCLHPLPVVCLRKRHRAPGVRHRAREANTGTVQLTMPLVFLQCPVDYDG